MSHWTFSITPTNLSLNLTTKSTISIRNPTTHRLQSNKYLLQSSHVSSNEKISNESTLIYQESLKKSGYDYKLKYQKIPQQQTQNNNGKETIWFNPPYSMNVATNVGRIFFNLINKHFPPHHKFSKIFNRNNMKISYSCMPNMKSRINIHNKKVTKAKPSAQTRTCNCIN